MANMRRLSLRGCQVQWRCVERRLRGLTCRGAGRAALALAVPSISAQSTCGRFNRSSNTIGIRPLGVGPVEFHSVTTPARYLERIRSWCGNRPRRRRDRSAFRRRTCTPASPSRNARRSTARAAMAWRAARSAWKHPGACSTSSREVGSTSWRSPICAISHFSMSRRLALTPAAGATGNRFHSGRTVSSRGSRRGAGAPSSCSIPVRHGRNWRWSCPAGRRCACRPGGEEIPGAREHHVADHAERDVLVAVALAHAADQARPRPACARAPRRECRPRACCRRCCAAAPAVAQDVATVACEAACMSLSLK